MRFINHKILKRTNSNSFTCALIHFITSFKFLRLFDERVRMKFLAFILFCVMQVSAASSIQVVDVFARATNGKNGAVFMTLKNEGVQSDKLIAATVSNAFANKCELHTHVVEGNTYRMSEVSSIDVPAGSEVRLKPGGLHLMVMGLKQHLVRGGTFDLTLAFESGANVNVAVPVKSAGAMSASCGCQS